MITNNKTRRRRSFKYKARIIGNKPVNNNNNNNNNTLDAKVVVPLRYLSNFCRFLRLPLINCEMELDLS